MKKGCIFGLALSTMVILFGNEGFAQWVPTNGPYDGGPVCSLGVTDSFVYAGTVGYGVFSSRDGGMSWAPCDSTGATTYALSMAGSGNYLYAGSGIGEGISISTDGGASWKVDNNGLPPNPWVSGRTGVIDRIAASGRNVFITMRLSPPAYLSTDNGSSWVDANTGSLYGISAIAVDGNDFFVGDSDGVYVSSDAGANWARAGLVDSTIVSLAVDGSYLFAATRFSVFVSSNDGSSWSSADAGLPKGDIGSLSANGGEVMVSTSGQRFYFSDDNGATWDSLTAGGFPASWAGPDAYVPIGRNFILGFFDFGIYRSTITSATWSPSNTGIRTSGIASLVTDGKTVLASYGTCLFRSSDDGSTWTQIMTEAPILASDDSTVFATAGDGVEYTTDGGTTWMEPANRNSPEGVQYLALAAGGNNLYLGAAGICGLCSQGGIYLSTDKGATWNAKGLANVVKIAATATAVYAIYQGGPLVRSLDNGSTWQSVKAPVAFFNTIAARDSEVFAGTNGHGVFRSTDYGAEWESVDAGLPLDSNETVNCFSFHGRYVFAGTGSGVFVLPGSATRWRAVGIAASNLDRPVSSLAASDSTLFAASYGRMWRFPLTEVVTGVRNSEQNLLPSAFQLSQNYPNPFNPSTVIRFGVRSTGLVILKVYDVLGRSVRTLVDKVEQPGTYSVTFDSGNLPSGVYFYTLREGTTSLTKKALLIK